MSEYKACPCHHLDEPCHPRCTCLNILSSSGCHYCCSYGSKEQRKQAAEHIKAALIEYRNP